MKIQTIVALSLVLETLPTAAAFARVRTGDVTDLRYGAWGVDLTARDLGSKPGDDFDRYAGGAWADRTPIPADAIEAGVYDDLEQLSRRRVAAIVVSSEPTSRIGALYRSYLDEAGVDRRGAAALRPLLARVDAARDRAELARVLGEQKAGFGLQPVEFSGDVDINDPQRPCLYVGQGGLGLPDRDYYLTDRFARERTAYRTYVETLLKLDGDGAAGADAGQVLAFETELARVHATRADARDLAKSLRSKTIGDLEREAPGLPWGVLFAGAGLSVHDADPVVVGQGEAVAGAPARNPR